MTAAATTRPRLNSPERDLVAAVRAELASVEPARPCCRVAERQGLGGAAQGRARTPVIGRLAIRLLDTGAAEEADIDWAGAAVHCRIAWLRGTFLARGSLSLAAGRTHLEFVVPAEEAEMLAGRLAEFEVPSGIRTRRGRGVVTSKSSEAVIGLLRRLGSTAASLELESRFVARTLRGHLNRVVNAENANLARSVATARRQLADIDLLGAAGGLASLPARVRMVAEARRAAPEASFTELAEQLGMRRASVQRAFETIAARASEVATGGQRRSDP